MVSYINQKKHLKKEILEAVDSAGTLDKDKLIAQLCLNSGFTELTVKKIIKQLETLDYIKVDGMVITRPDKEPQGSEQQ